MAIEAQASAYGGVSGSALDAVHRLPPPATRYSPLARLTRVGFSVPLKSSCMKSAIPASQGSSPATTDTRGRTSTSAILARWHRFAKKPTPMSLARGRVAFCSFSTLRHRQRNSSPGQEPAPDLIRGEVPQGKRTLPWHSDPESLKPRCFLSSSTPGAAWRGPAPSVGGFSCLPKRRDNPSLEGSGPVPDGAEGWKAMPNAAPPPRH